MQKLIVTLLLLLPFSILYAQDTLNVPGEYSTIQAAINAATNGDVVLVAEDTYYENIDFMGKAITVASHFLVDGNETHIENTIIDGSQPTNPDSGSVVFFISGEDTNSVLCGFTITGGSGTYYSVSDYRLGGGIMLFLSGAKICHNIITSNTIDNSTIYTRCYGGGIFVFSQSYNSIISYNEISNNLIENSSAVGGGISIWQTGPTWIISNKIINNVINCSGGSGGGIDIWVPNSELYVRNNIIRGNQVLSNNYGGGGIDIWNSSSPVFISNNLITENVGNLGGGILVDNPTDGDFRKLNSLKLNNHILGVNDRLDNSTFPTNKALLEAVIENNTVVNNNAASYCGGIYCRNSSPEIRNSIVWGNQAPAGSQIEGAGFVEYSDVEGGYTGTGNIDCNPGFLDTTYFLLSDSSCCIDAGHPAPIYNDVEDPNNTGYALYPAMGTLRNDMGTFGGPNSTWSSVLSDTLHVPADYPTIQAAIDAATNGDVVLVAEDTYYENINFKGKAITVASHFLIDDDSTHIENTVIEGSQPLYPDSASVVSFISGEDTTSVLCGFTITGGTGTVGQAPTRAGGGIVVYESGATICNNIIEYNSLDSTNAFGGGIYVGYNNNIAIVKNNIIRNNSVVGTYPNGGGIALNYSGLTYILSNKIIDNEAIGTNAGGGGIDLLVSLDKLIIENNYIKGNSATQTNQYGGGGIDIYNWGAPVLVSNNVIVENTSSYKGGGIFVNYSANASFKTTTITMSLEYSQHIPLLVNNTIFNNSAYNGGGIHCEGSTPNVMNSIIWGNTSTSGGQIGGTATVEYSDVEGGYPGTGNIDLDPEFSSSHAYFPLSGTSPCIDAGNPDAQYNDVEDPQNLGNALWPAQGTLINDMGHCGGPSSLWHFWAWPMPVESSSLSVSEFALMHNYPNPFNPTTTIKYDIKERTDVELKVFDILGREIITLVNEEKQSGSYELVFDASTLSSGVYFYQLRAGDYIDIKKMILLK